MTFGLAHPGYHLPKGQAGKLNFFAPWNGNYNPFKIKMKIKSSDLSKQIENQLHSVTGIPDVFCGYKISHVIGQNTHSRNIFSVHGFLRLSVKFHCPFVFYLSLSLLPPFFAFLSPLFFCWAFTGLHFGGKSVCENPRIPLRNRAY